MSSFVHQSPTTKVTLSDNKIHKKFIGDDRESRFEKELKFLKTHKSKHLPKLIDFDSKNLELMLHVLRSETPGFLDNTESSLLKADDFKRIRNALSEIQKLSEKLIVHGDLAPHNIYLTDKRVVIADWDSYFHAENPDYKLYDYATFWSLLDVNEDELKKIFQIEFENMTTEGVISSFSNCYSKRVDFLKKYPKQFEQGRGLREYILDQLDL